MYKLLPNPSLYIDNELRFYNNVEEVVFKHDKKSCITIMLYGIPITKTPVWFYLLAKYKIDLPREIVLI